MSSTDARARPLGRIDPAGSRQRGRRSSVLAAGDRTVAGTHDGDIVAYEGEGNGLDWRADAGESVVTLAGADGLVLAGTRGPDGWVRAFDMETGTEQWTHRVADDVGGPQRDTRFYQPFVVDACVRDVGGVDGRDAPQFFVAARRYERRDGADSGADARHFESVVYAFDAGGSICWQYTADASPISLAVDGERVAIAYNRCPGEHQCGLVVLDAADGQLRADWDPGTEGQRRVGDVSLLPEGVVVASHGDYRGYVLDRDGDVRWSVDLATTTTVGDERLYAYPNHVHATGDGVAFLTGNTYPEEGREAEGRHPGEHTISAFDLTGEHRWSASLDGWVTGVGFDGSLLAAPVAQHFRDRDPDAHGLRVFDVSGGLVESFDTAGVATAADVSGGRLVGVEEPVVYHDEGTERGAYRLHEMQFDD